MKRHALLRIIAAAAASIGCWHSAIAQQTFTYDDLVHRLIDFERLAVLPADGETCKQWSSWDRSSQYDAETATYLNWQANNDGPNFIRQEGDAMVMAEMEGPGCIWRTWSARAETGHVKIYLDGAEQPAVDLPFANYFSGDTPPFDYPMLSYNLADHGCRGQNLYFPIPYQKSCKVVAESGWGRYYQFVYTTFSKGTELPTFNAALVAEHRSTIQNVNAFLSDGLGTDPAGRRERQLTRRHSIRLEPGQTKSLTGLAAGPRAITAIRANMDFKDREDQMAALRKLVLKITWDDQQQPAVWCPLGDFFGTAPGENLYKSLVTGMTEDGYYAYWYMPYEKKAVVELVNEDEVPRELELEIVDSPLARPFDGLGHFHSKWHRGTKQLPEDRWPDWVMLKTKGRGRYCGVMLHVWNPHGGWWGEGDEKFFVDGEKYPSTFGTGSEDYFGYAWCNPGLFQRPFHCQTMTQNNRGHQSVLRWQIADNVPFATSFEGCIEKYYRTEEKGTQYACTACWYLAPAGVDPYGPIPVDRRHDYYQSPPLVVGGFKVLGEPRGRLRTQRMERYQGVWQDNDHLWWTNAAVGDTLELALEVKQTGTYRVSAVLTKARDYGIVQLSVDGRQAGGPIDLYNPTVVPTEPIPLGTFPLEEGKHTLGVKIIGANDRAVKSYMFGLDHVILEAE